jgi:hypothetical protein
MNAPMRHILFGETGARLAEVRVLWEPGMPIARVALWVAPPCDWGFPHAMNYDEVKQMIDQEGTFDWWVDGVLAPINQGGAASDVVSVDCAWPAEFAVKDV